MNEAVTLQKFEEQIGQFFLTIAALQQVQQVVDAFRALPGLSPEVFSTTNFDKISDLYLLARHAVILRASVIAEVNVVAIMTGTGAWFDHSGFFHSSSDDPETYLEAHHLSGKVLRVE